MASVPLSRPRGCDRSSAASGARGSGAELCGAAFPARRHSSGFVVGAPSGDGPSRVWAHCDREHRRALRTGVRPAAARTPERSGAATAALVARSREAVAVRRWPASRRREPGLDDRDGRGLSSGAVGGGRRSSHTRGRRIARRRRVRLRAMPKRPGARRWLRSRRAVRGAAARGPGQTGPAADQACAGRRPGSAG